MSGRGRPMSSYSAGAVRISYAWVGIIVAGVGAFVFAKTDLDRRREEQMRIEGPQYRMRQKKEGVPFKDMEELNKTVKTMEEMQKQQRARDQAGN
eukprot:m.78762 g.78762  ORF g.78762 m.78762 type:complete len:95 (+) comp16250_c0_seq2:206-490(+)